MPELPEVETMRRALVAHLKGERITKVQVVRHDLRVPIPREFAAVLQGKRFLSFQRRSKYILAELDTHLPVGRRFENNPNRFILFHMGMSGRILLGERGRLDWPKHSHLIIHTANHKEMVFIDPRRFGMVDIVADINQDARLSRLGWEPFDAQLTPLVFHQQLGRYKNSVRARLLDQNFIAGLGNIYVAEALYQARIHPDRACDTIDLPTAEKLLAAIREILSQAIESGGSSLRDYRQSSGDIGYFQHKWAVYQHQGQLCPFCPRRTNPASAACSGIAVVKSQGRSSFFCPYLQK